MTATHNVAPFDTSEFSQCAAVTSGPNPGKFSLSSPQYSGAEHTQVMVTVSRTDGNAGSVSVDYATGGGNATPFVDYTPASGTLIFETATRPKLLRSTF